MRLRPVGILRQPTAHYLQGHPCGYGRAIHKKRGTHKNKNRGHSIAAAVRPVQGWRYHSFTFQSIVMAMITTEPNAVVKGMLVRLNEKFFGYSLCECTGNSCADGRHELEVIGSGAIIYRYTDEYIQVEQ